MKQLKHIQNNLFIVDTINQDKPVNTWVYYKGKVAQINVLTVEDKDKHLYSKIVGQLNPELPNIPLFPLPAVTINVKDLAIKTLYGTYAKSNEHEMWIEGYNQALSDNKEKLYTISDLRNAYNHGLNNLEFQDVLNSLE